MAQQFEGMILEDSKNPDKLKAELPKEMMDLLEWQEGDMLAWLIEDDNITLKKKKG